MSKVSERIKRTSVPDIFKNKGGVPLVCLTAYTYPMAKILDKHVDILLVGDSVGVVLYGMENTHNVTLEMMIGHGKAVVKGSEYACVICDMPFGSYQESPELAFRNAAKVIAETGCAGIKIEGGVEMAETVEFLVKRGVPVMGHVGLKPQSINTVGGYKSQGHSEDEVLAIQRDAQSISDAGAFSVVLECMVEEVAAEVTKNITAVTIGIGASARCDGQVLVTEDMLGIFTDFQPKFVKQYIDLQKQIDEATQLYASEVKDRIFPSSKHVYQKK